MGNNPQDPSERLGNFLRQQYPATGAVKLLAAELNITPKAAENMLTGHWPGARHWSAIARRFGRDVLDAVFAPDIDATLARLTAEERELEQRLEKTRSARRQAEGCLEGPSPRLAANEDRAAVEARSRGERTGNCP